MADEKRNTNLHQLQWNPSNSDPNENEESVHIKVARNVLGGEKISSIREVSSFQREEFHMSNGVTQHNTHAQDMEATESKR